MSKIISKSILANERIGHMSMQKISTFYIRRPEDLHSHAHHSVPPARAAVHCFFYLTSGEVSVDIGALNYVLRKNSCAIIPAGQVFAVKYYKNCKGFMGGFHNDFFVGGLGVDNLLKRFDFLRLWGNPQIKIDSKSAKLITDIFNRIYTEYTDKSCDSDIIRAYLFSALVEMNKIYRRTFSNNFTSAEIITNRFKELIFENIKSKKTVAEYAAELNISPNHLNKTVKQITGKSPSIWVDEILVSEAKILLYQTNMQISDVAVAVGVLDQSYFSRIFKKYEGVSPANFRKMIEKS